ncbi:hypothetical protein ACLOJK_006317 [Asimina triloba]
MAVMLMLHIGCEMAIAANVSPFAAASWQSVYEHHPRPKQLIVENDLPQKLERLIEEQNKFGQRSGDIYSN